MHIAEKHPRSLPVIEYSNVKTCGYVLSWIFDYNLASSITSLLLLTLMTAGLA